MTTITLEQVVRATRSVRDGTVMGAEGNEARFADGVDTGNKSESVSIALNNVWGACGKDGSSTSSYEKIGYHAGSVDFIAGVLSTGCPITVYRETVGGWTEFRLVA